ncbi:MAG: hypothetical protein LBE35_10420 [Clostridiales bacterium]|jgi:hypothetical protein|nr:hypothetical protein [Clostridiales bacterium]
MNKGVIVQIEQNVVHVLKNDGGFVSLPKNPDWEIGEIITITRRSRVNLILIPIVAVLLIASTVVFMQVYRIPVTFIEMSVNPAVQLEINRFNRVLNVRELNPEAAPLIQGLNYRNRPLAQVFDHLATRFANNDHFGSGTNVQFAIANDSFDDFLEIEATLQEILSRIPTAQNPQISIMRFDLNEYQALEHPIPFREIDEEVHEGHGHGRGRRHRENGWWRWNCRD